MKKILLILSTVFAFVSCITVNTIFPSGNITTENKYVDQFQRIDVSAGIELIVSNGQQEVQIETYENIHRYIDVYVRNNCLYIKPSGHISFGGKTRIKAYVTNDIIQRIEASGGSHVVISQKIISEQLSLIGSGGSHIEGAIECNNLEIELGGGGKAELSIDCASLKGNSSGGSVFDLEGVTERADINISGGGVMNGFYLACGSLYAQLSGGSEINSSVTNHISADLSGGSKLKYKGNPEIKANTSGGSKVINAN